MNFIVNQWQYDDRIKNTNPNIFYATAGTKCYNLSRVDMTEVSSLSTSQEEVDNRSFYILRMHWITCKKILLSTVLIPMCSLFHQWFQKKLMQILISKPVIKIKKELLMLKLASAIFYQIFIFFSPNNSPLKTMKNVFYFT